MSFERGLMIRWIRHCSPSVLYFIVYVFYNGAYYLPAHNFRLSAKYMEHLTAMINIIYAICSFIQVKMSLEQI